MKQQREAYTRRPRGCREEGWWRGQSPTAKIMAEELIDAAAYQSIEVFDAGRIVRLGPGDALFSIPELMELTGGTERQVRNARAALRAAGFIVWSYRRGGKARCLYSLTQWRRFIEPTRVDENAEVSQPGQTAAVKGQSTEADDRPDEPLSENQQGQSSVSQASVKPSRSSRANVQSTEHRATEGVQEKERSQDRISTSAREVQHNPWALKPLSESSQKILDELRNLTPEEIARRSREAVAKLESWCRDNGEPWVEIGGANGTSSAN